MSVEDGLIYSQPDVIPETALGYKYIPIKPIETEYQCQFTAKIISDSDIYYVYINSDLVIFNSREGRYEINKRYENYLTDIVITVTEKELNS